jgi:putative phosphoesterase
MKILVISDSHGNVANLKHVMGFAKKINVEAIIHCGDWNTIDTIETVLSFGIPLYTVLGNADVRPEVITELKKRSKKFGEEFLEFELGGRKIGVTHKPSDIKKFFADKKLDVIFCGHRHQQKEFFQDGIRIVNPGSLENNVNFAVYDTTSDKIEFINE